MVAPIQRSAGLLVVVKGVLSRGDLNLAVLRQIKRLPHIRELSQRIPVHGKGYRNDHRPTDKQYQTTPQQSPTPQFWRFCGCRTRFRHQNPLGFSP